MPLPRLLFLLCLLAALAVTVRAQVPRPLPTAAPALPTAPAGVPNPIISGANVAPAPAEPATTHLDFTNSPVTDVLHWYEQLSGKHVLYDTSVQGQITLNVSNITRTQAVRIIETALNLNGFAIVPSDDNVVKVLGLGKPVRPAGVPIYLDIRDVPDTEQMVTLLVHLSYLEAQETAGMLTQYIPPGSAIGFTPLPKAAALLLTDTGRSVRRIFALIQQIDVSPLSVEDRFIRLERADAAKAVEFLNSVFETKTSGAPGGAGAAAIPGLANTVRRPIRRVGEDGVPVDVNGLAAQGGAGGPGNNGNNGDTLIVGRITLTADVRTNRVHIVTNRRNMDVVERLLADYDAETRFAAPVRRPLLFVSAKDVLPILVQSLTEPGTEGGANGGAGGTTPGTTNPNRNGSSNSSNLFNNNSNSSSGGLGGSGSGGASSIGSEGLDTQSVDTTPTEATVGNTKLIADQRSNTIIILGGADAREKVREVLDQLDVRSPQVVIRTVIGELSLTDDKEFGLNYLLRSRRGTLLSQFNSGQIPAASAAASPSGSPTAGASALNTFTTLATGLGQSFSGVGGIIAIGNSLDIIVSALDSTNRFKTVSRPMIFTQNNKKAIIASGQEIAVPTNSVGTTNSASTSGVGTYTNIEYKSVTLQLEVVPLINSNKEITLDILQKIDSLVAGASTTVNGNPIPTIATRYLKSTVSAPNDSTIVLGGLITQNETKQDSNIPYLNRIPIIGKLLFSTRTRDNDRSELIILMHPEVINTPPLLTDLREREEDRTYLGPKMEEQIRPLTVRKAIPVTPGTTPVRTKKTVATVPLVK